METPLSTLLQNKPDALYRIESSATAAEAIRIMNDANIGCVLVVDTDGLVGIFSERDVLRRVADRGLDPKSVVVRDVMTTKLITVPPSLTVEQAQTLCTERRIRHLPVTENGRLLGLVSLGDLVRSTISDQARTIDGLINYIHGPQIGT